MRLKPIYPSRFLEWIQRSGFTDEKHFWSFLSEDPTNQGTSTDHMNTYLGTLGYVGQPGDRFRQFLRDQTSLIGATFDMGNQFFDGTWVTTPSGDPLTTEDGVNLTTESGDNILTE